MTSWAPLALTTVTAALLALPITPALFELWKRSDATPLPTSRHDGRIENFAEAFRSRLQVLRPQLERCRIDGEMSRTRIDDMVVLLVGSTSSSNANGGPRTKKQDEDFNFQSELTDGVDALMFCHDALVPAGKVVEADMYSDGTLELAEGAVIRGARGEGDITLQRNSSALRWLHADGSIYMRQGSNAYGRLSAGQTIRLERGCGFEHMQAPQILTVDAQEDDASGFLPSFSGSGAHVCQARDANGSPVDDSSSSIASVGPAGDVLSSARPRIRVQGNFVLPAGETLSANVIATGELHLGSGARLFGSAKSYKDTIIGDDACVHGSIVCRGTVRIGSRCYVTGPVMAEGDVFVARGGRIGRPDAPTTISSCGAQIAPGCQIHGTVWARVRGNVEA